ncbi:MAG: alpha-galactosidase, partial [Candidatus Thorarchaeota archaeon]
LVSEEMLFLVPDDLQRGLQTYAEITSRRMEARIPAEPITGWCSWYFYYTQPDEDEIRLNMQFIREEIPGLKLIQLDDGYQKTVGDWRENDRFPSGLAKLAAEISDAGFTPGIWIAPFVASEHSELFKSNPDLFVHGEDGRPLRVGNNPLWLGDYYALDLTNPLVLNRIESEFRLLKEAGFEYFKIDFLYHSTVPGKRHNPRMTRAQALRAGLETIRRVVGDDYVLGCGAPIGSSIGVVDGMRIGTDIAPAWHYDWGGGVYECSINTISRSFMHNRWWANDPDCVIVRQSDTELTIDEVQLWLSVVALSGGLLLVSDRMPDLSSERICMLKKIMPVYGRGGLAVDSLTQKEPRVFALPIESDMGKWTIAALLNLSEQQLDISVPLARLGREDGPCDLYEFWKQEYAGRAIGSLEVRGLQPHSVRLYAIRPERKEPHVLGTSMHFTQGAVEISDHKWDATLGELSFVVHRNTDQEEKVAIIHRGWTLIEATTDAAQCKTQAIAPEVTAVMAKFHNGQTVRARFSKVGVSQGTL